MNTKFLKRDYFYLLFVSIFIACSSHAEESLIDKVLIGDHRELSYIERDKYRHPKETLNFFGVTPDQKVVEITPGHGWYAEILAPLLRDKGQYTYTSYKLHDDINPYFVKMETAFKEKMAKHPQVFNKLEWVHFESNEPNFAPNGKADAVLTFRNIHNWAKAGSVESMFIGFYNALKPGGTLGVVEHRAEPGTPFEEQIKSGYMTFDYVVQLAEKTGFRLAESSEINANPKDTKSHPNGVWSLLPNLRGIDDGNKSAMKKIGESDRMTLKFIKD